MKYIFNDPICNRIECGYNDPNYTNNCSITTMVERCGLVDIEYPRRIQKTLSWIDKYWLRIAVVCLAASVFIYWTLFAAGLGATSAIDDLRAEYNKTCMRDK